ncbi:zinc finger protein 2 homolog isoform X2 [Scaptodrosophila lebanonensis]|uniref:Zinc finger protein 2 homolog isoform X2 n=1 Tax=Drosophila lebanonensis TaxID=7225 RepID=A0A6J2TNP3_DROLE|nr:zinc finger protein 2 homolog isoform X2 [Scaptodrosophila lebanonensis]
MPRCAVHSCENKTRLCNKRISFFGFPKKKQVLKQWLQFCDSDVEINPGTDYICSQHFSPEDIQGSLSQRTLKPGSIPRFIRNDMDIFDQSCEKVMGHRNNKRNASQKGKRCVSRARKRATTTDINLRGQETELILDESVEEKRRKRVKCSSKKHTLSLPKTKINPLDEMPVDIKSDGDAIELDQELEQVMITNADQNVTEIFSSDNTNNKTEESIYKRERITECTCRICNRYFSADEDAKDLYQDSSSYLLYNIETISGVMIQLLDGLPHYICPNCLSDLDRATTFRENCIRTDQILQLERQQQQDNPHIIKDNAKLDEYGDSKILVQITESSTPELTAEVFTDYVNDSESVYGAQVEIGEKQEPHAAHKIPEGNNSNDPLSVGLGEPNLNSLIQEANGGAEKASPKKRIKKAAKEDKCIPNQNHNYNQKIVCHICGYFTYRSGNFKEHMLRHTRTKNFKCPQCPETFYTNYSKQLHVRVKHNNEKPFNCRYCDRVFTQRASRNYHEKMFHATKKLEEEKKGPVEPQVELPHCCIYCTKSFDTEYTLEHHMKGHNTDTPFKCKHCEERFVSFIEANKHELTHNEQPFVCNICSKGFSGPARLRYHMVKHSDNRPYKCEICSVGFRRRYDLDTHFVSLTHEKKLKQAAGGGSKVT